MNRLSGSAIPAKLLSPAAPEFESLLRWLVSRQTPDLGEEPDDDDSGHHEKGDSLQEDDQENSLTDKVLKLPSIQPPDEASLQWAGFNGRCNKAADTCYSFWNTGTLAVSDPSDSWLVLY